MKKGSTSLLQLNLCHFAPLPAACLSVCLSVCLHAHAGRVCAELLRVCINSVSVRPRCFSLTCSIHPFACVFTHSLIHSPISFSTACHFFLSMNQRREENGSQDVSDKRETRREGEGGGRGRVFFLPSFLVSTISPCPVPAASAGEWTGSGERETWIPRFAFLPRGNK